ncbi:MAG TPA: hypothetical protein PKO15_17390 [Fibrobacteria bacterium]|nr:hypothetical protein [Fibrobacteria bacterium]HOX52016.1 hypothetical protein [Fibrobacteria bacterium]
MNDLAVDVRTIPVRIFASPDQPTDLDIFLPAADPPGAHGLLGRLNDGDRFLPMRVDGEIRLMAKTAIRALVVGFVLPEIQVLDDLGAKDVHLRIHLRDGRTMEGSAAILLPELRGRPLDFLNLEERFFALTSLGGTVVVNKDWVEFVEPAESP